MDSRRFALLRLASRARREGAHDTAVELWQEAASAGEWTALRQLAIHHEHRQHDLRAALEAVDRALSCASTLDARDARRAFDDLGPRRERLLRKLETA